MTWAERKNFEPADAWQRGQQQIDIAVNNAVQETRTSLDRLGLDGKYLVPNPWPMLQEIGDFTESTARAAWADIRETWGTGVQLTNAIRTVLSDECADDWFLLVETALPAAGAAIMLLLTPSPGEILENYLEPKALRSSGRGAKDTKKVRRRRGRSGRIRRSFPRIPDVDRLIADRLPGRQAVEGRRATAPTRWLFKGINVADRFLWYALLFEAGDVFISQWNSNLIEARFCSETFLSKFSCSYAKDDPLVSYPCPIGRDDQTGPASVKNMNCSISNHLTWVGSLGTHYNATKGRIYGQAAITADPEIWNWAPDAHLSIAIYNETGSEIERVTESFTNPDKLQSYTIEVEHLVSKGYACELQLDIVSFGNPGTSAEVDMTADVSP